MVDIKYRYTLTSQLSFSQIFVYSSSLRFCDNKTFISFIYKIVYPLYLFYNYIAKVSDKKNQNFHDIPMH